MLSIGTLTVRLKGTSYHIIVTLWLAIQRHGNYSTRNLKNPPTSDIRTLFLLVFSANKWQKKSGLHK